MSDRDEKEKSPDVSQPEKRLALEGGVAVASPSKGRSSSSSSGSKVKQQGEEMEPESEEMEQSPVRKGSSKLVRQCSSQSLELSTSALTLSPMEDEEARMKITITQIIYTEEYVEYVYSVKKTIEETEEETDTEMEWADEEGSKAEKQKSEPKKSPTFIYPIFNQQTSGIYNRYIQKDSSYYIERHDKMIMKADLYDENNIECISLKMFKEIAKTLTTPPKVMEVNEERKVMVCGTIKNSYEAFLNFDTKTPILISYLIRLADQNNRELEHVKPEHIVTGEMYAVVDRKNHKYSRLIFPEGYLEKTKKYREFAEKIRSEQAGLEMSANYSDDEREKRAHRRNRDAERESETFIFLSVDTGMGCFRHIEDIYRLSDVCQELLDIPPQATKVLVTSLDHDPKYLPLALEGYYPDPQVLMAKRVQEPDGEIPRVELVSLPMKSNIWLS